MGRKRVCMSERERRRRRRTRRSLAAPSPAHSVQRYGLCADVETVVGQDVAQVVGVELQEVGGEAVDPGEVLQQELVSCHLDGAAREGEGARQGPDLHARLQADLLHEGVTAGLEKAFNLEPVGSLDDLYDCRHVRRHIPGVRIPWLRETDKTRTYANAHVRLAFVYQKKKKKKNLSISFK